MRPHLCPGLNGTATPSALHLVHLDHGVNVHFNAYVRMSLGIGKPFLTFYVQPFTNTGHLLLMVKEGLALDPKDDRFALYGQVGAQGEIWNDDRGRTLIM